MKMMRISADVERQNGNRFVDLEALAGEESAETDEQEWEGNVLSSSCTSHLWTTSTGR